MGPGGRGDRVLLRDRVDGGPVTLFGDTRHKCHASSCDVVIPAAMFMCRWHWHRLPKPIRDAVWATYVPGQERRKDPSREYLAAATRAIEWLERLEGTGSGAALRP